MRNASRLVAFVASAAFLIFSAILIPSAPAQAQRSGGGSSGGGSHGGGAPHGGGSAAGSSGGAHNAGSGSSGAAHASSSSGGSHSSHASSAHPSSSPHSGAGDSRGGANQFGAGHVSSGGAGRGTETTVNLRTPRANSWDPLQFAGISGASGSASRTAPARSASGAAVGSKPAPTYHRRVDVKMHPKKKKQHQPPSNSGFYFLTGGGAYYLPPGSGDDGAVYVDNGSPDNANAADDNDTADDSQAADASAAPGADAAAANASDVAEELSADATPPPVPDEGEFTLVLHDGTRIQAMAFTHSNKKIVYITTDGMRRAFADSLLDADETVRVNQERGTPLQSPL